MASPEPEAKDAKKKTIVEKQQEKKLAFGQILKSEKGTEYHVETLLGAGGFGEVWKVTLWREPEKSFAMKIEPNTGPSKKMLRLKCEVNLFDEIARYSNRLDKSHFLKMHDKGKTSAFKYIVMDLIWLSLKEVKMKVCGGVFTPHTLIKVARQTLKSIESLHEIGFLHRDIKAENFAVGLPPKDAIVFMLDFGIARPFRDEHGEVRKARKEVQFLGTFRYASLECLCRREQACRDDLEVWMYMMLELYDKCNIFWSFLEDEELQLHIDMRTQLMQKSREMLAAKSLKVPEKWCEIIDLLSGMDFEETGDFTQLNLLLTQICIDENIDENLPLDWAGKAPLPEPPKRKYVKKEAKPRPKKNSEQQKTTDDDEKGVARKKKISEKTSDDDEKRVAKKKKISEHKKTSDRDDELKDRKPRREKTEYEEDSFTEDLTSDAEINFEEFRKWKKRNKKKKNRTGEGDSDREGKPSGPKKKTGSKASKASKASKKNVERKKSKASTKEDEETKEVDAPEMKIPSEGQEIVEPKKGPEKKKERIPEPKKDKEKLPTPKKKNMKSESNKSDDKEKKNRTPESNESANDKDDKEKKVTPKKKGGTIEESGNEKDDKEKKATPKKKGGTIEESGNEKDDKEKKVTPKKKKRSTNETKDEEKDEKGLQQKKPAVKAPDKKVDRKKPGRSVDQSIEDKDDKKAGKDVKKKDEPTEKKPAAKGTVPPKKEITPGKK